MIRPGCDRHRPGDRSTRVGQRPFGRDGWASPLRCASDRREPGSPGEHQDAEADRVVRAGRRRRRGGFGWSGRSGRRTSRPPVRDWRARLVPVPEPDQGPCPAQIRAGVPRVESQGSRPILDGRLVPTEGHQGSCPRRPDRAAGPFEDGPVEVGEARGGLAQLGPQRTPQFQEAWGIGFEDQGLVDVVQATATIAGPATDPGADQEGVGRERGQGDGPARLPRRPCLPGAQQMARARWVRIAIAPASSRPRPSRSAAAGGRPPGGTAGREPRDQVGSVQEEIAVSARREQGPDLESLAAGVGPEAEGGLGIGQGVIHRPIANGARARLERSPAVRSALRAAKKGRQVGLGPLGTGPARSASKARPSRTVVSPGSSASRASNSARARSTAPASRSSFARLKRATRAESSPGPRRDHLVVDRAPATSPRSWWTEPAPVGPPGTSLSRAVFDARRRSSTARPQALGSVGSGAV